MDQPLQKYTVYTLFTKNSLKEQIIIICGAWQIHLNCFRFDELFCPKHCYQINYVFYSI